MTYTLTADTSMIIRDQDQAHIPTDPANRDYQTYQAWIAAGNAPNPYVAPPASPLMCTPYQFRQALMQQNLRTQVEALIANAATPQAIKDAYSFAQVFIETDPNIVAMATQIGQTATQIHALFQLAATLNV